MISGTQIYNKALQDAIEVMQHHQPCTCNHCKEVWRKIGKLKK